MIFLIKEVLKIYTLADLGDGNKKDATMSSDEDVFRPVCRQDFIDCLTGSLAGSVKIFSTRKAGLQFAFHPILQHIEVDLPVFLAGGQVFQVACVQLTEIFMDNYLVVGNLGNLLSCFNGSPEW